MDRGFHDIHLNEPITDGVILRRDESGVYTNVPHLVVHHSPSGYEWAYYGSGPADLALNIVELALMHLGYRGKLEQCWQGRCFRLAYALHQRFKRDFIAKANRQGATIPFEDVLAWVKQRMPQGEDEP